MALNSPVLSATLNHISIEDIKRELGSPPASCQVMLADHVTAAFIYQESGQVRLRLESIAALSDRETPALRGVSLEVQSGEILGLAGISGNGQKELAEVGRNPASPSEGRRGCQKTRPHHSPRPPRPG